MKIRTPFGASLALALLPVLAACQAVMKTDYQLVPPNSRSQGMCASGCVTDRQTCLIHCTAEKNDCVAKAQTNAENDYSNYASEQAREGRTASKSEGDFYHLYDYKCNSDACEESCGATMRGCYTACGGQVIPYSYCAAFCK